MGQCYGCAQSGSVGHVGYSLVLRPDGSVVVRTLGSGPKPFVIGPFASEAAAWAWIANSPTASREPCLTPFMM